MTDKLFPGNFKIFILTGNPGSGKSYFLDRLSGILRAGGLNLGGFIAPSVKTGSPSRSYELKDIRTDISLPLASETYTNGWEKAGKFFFNPDAIAAGNNILAQHKVYSNDIIIIDEIGPLELDGKIWADALDQVCRMKCSHMILIVRKKLLEKVILRWKLEDPHIIDIESQSPEEAARLLMNI